MIKCNLAVLLAERGLKMADIINDTSLSKTSVRGLYYNESRGIQYETLETVCDYLNVEPGDLIKKIDFSHQLLERNIDRENKIVDYKVLFKFDQKEFEYVIRLKLRKVQLTDDKNPLERYSLHGIYLDFIFEKEFKQNIFSQLTTLERMKFEDVITADFIFSLNLQEHPLREINFIDNHKF